MSKIKITINEALQLKEQIQEKLSRNQIIFKTQNSVPVSRKRNYNLKKLITADEDLRRKMVALKLLIQEANLKITEGETNSLQHYVFLLSEKKRQIDNVKAIPTFEGPFAVKDKIITYSVVFNNRDKEDWLDKLSKEYREISNKLTKINSSLTIELPFDPSKI